MASVDVDPKVAAAFAAGATELAGRAVWASGRATVPEWVGTVAELLYDWAAGVPWPEGHTAGTAGQVGATQPPSAAGTHGPFLGGVLAGHVAPAAPPSPPRQPLAGPGTTVRALLEEVRTARLAIGVADALAVALRAGHAEQVAKCLAAFEQASRTYHATAGEDPGDDDDGGPAS